MIDAINASVASEAGLAGLVSRFRVGSAAGQSSALALCAVSGVSLDSGDLSWLLLFVSPAW